MRRFWVLFLAAFFASLPAQPALAQRGGRGQRGGGGFGAAAAQAQQAAPAAAATSATPTEPLRTPADRPVDIHNIRLDLRVDLPKKTVEGRATLQLANLRTLSSFALDAVDFEINKVTLQTGDQEERPNAYHYDGQKLTIAWDKSWPVKHDATLRIDYRVREPKQGLHFFGPTTAEPNVPLQVWSQGEEITNRYWIPCLDQPNQRQTTEMVVTVNDGLDVLSNGTLVDKHENSDKTVTYDWREDNPYVAYLITLVVGKFEVVKEEWRGRPVLYYVPLGHRDDVERSFGHTRDMLTYLSDRFGIEFPWDKYAQVVVEQFTAGGMENATATTLTDRALKDARSMVDESSDSLIVHEMGHQWWGDMVTCREWAHTWLNEGFASYIEALWAEHHDGPDEGAYNMWLKSRRALNADRDRPIVDRRYPSPESMFDDRAYPKGAWVLHMLRRQLGDDVFFKCLQRYGTEFKFKVADTDDLRKAFERETGRSLERFFYDWTERPGHPVLEVRADFDPDTNQAVVSVKQTQAGEAFHFPLRVKFSLPPARTASEGSEGEEDVPNLQRPRVEDLDITDKEQTFHFTLPDRPSMVEVDPELSLLAELKETKSRQLWRAQLQPSASAISRYRAAQHFAQGASAGDRDQLAKVLANDKFWAVQAEAAASLAEIGGPEARDALIAGLKHAHPKVRRACAEQLGKYPRDAKAAAALKELLAKGDASYNVEVEALGAYAKLEQPDTVAVAKPWLDKSSNGEVLRSAALRALGASQDPSVLETLFSWSQRGKPRACRGAAYSALGDLAHSGKLTDEQQRHVVKAITESIETETGFMQFGAVTALRELGRAAAPALPTLEAMLAREPEGRRHQMLSRTIEQIRSGAPVAPELTRIQQELDKLRQDNAALKQRLDRVEKYEKK